MKTITKTDLEDLTLLLEDLVKRLPDMKREERIDVAARVRAAAKHLKAIDDMVKTEVKAARKGKEGCVKGEQWQARLTLVPVKRLDQTAFKEGQPKIHEQYCVDAEDQRITFEVR